MPVEIALVTSKGEQIRKITVAKAEEAFRFDLEERPQRVCFDPNDWILKDVSFHKDKEEWIDQAQHGEHLMSRIQAVGEIGGMKGDHDVRNALIELAKSDWLLGPCGRRRSRALAGFSGDEVRNCLIAVARDDAKSFVRREAVKALGKSAHDDTRAALRAVVKKDASYETAAEALRSLAKVDRAGCRDDLVAALDSESHRQAILRGGRRRLGGDRGCRSDRTSARLLEGSHNTRSSHCGSRSTGTARRQRRQGARGRLRRDGRLSMVRTPGRPTKRWPAPRTSGPLTRSPSNEPGKPIRGSCS